MKDWKRLPFICVGLAICNVIIYLCCLFGIGDFYIAGGLDAPAVIGEGEYYRIISSLFLHGNSTHLFNNMMILLFLGAMLEKELGHVRFLVLYFLSGIGGNLLSLYVKVREAEAAVSIGASGAIFGIMGAFLWILIRNHGRASNMSFVRVLFLVCYCLFGGLTEARIDNAAHFGGLFAGIIIAVLIYRKNKHKKEVVTGED